MRRDEIKAILRAHLATQPSAYWLARLEPADVWCAEVLDWPRLVEHAGFRALEMTQQVTNGADTLTTTRCPIRIDGRRLRSARAAPRLGEHTDAILREFGLAAEELSS